MRYPCWDGKAGGETSEETAPLWLSAAVLIALNFLLYLVALDNGFSLDDFNWLERVSFAPSWPQFVFEVEPGKLWVFAQHGLQVALNEARFVPK